MTPYSTLRLSILVFVSLALLGSLTPPIVAQDARSSGTAGGPYEGGPPIVSVRGTVTAVSNAQLAVKIDRGNTYRVLTNRNTQIMKNFRSAKFTDICPGDTVMIMGQVNAQAKTVGAAFVAVIGTIQAARMRENLGKTWTAGKAIAIEDLNVTIQRINGVSEAMVVNKNPSFHGQSFTLADIKVGDNVNARGSLKGGVFTASQLTVGGIGMNRNEGAEVSSAPAPQQ